VILKDETARTSTKRKEHEKGNGAAQRGRGVGRKSARRDGAVFECYENGNAFVRSSSEDMVLVLYEGVPGCVTSGFTDHAPYCEHGEGLSS